MKGTKDKFVALFPWKILLYSPKMSDADDFLGTENDPVADFLKREKDQLGELDDNFGAANDAPKSNYEFDDVMGGAPHDYGTIVHSDEGGFDPFSGSGAGEYGNTEETGADTGADAYGMIKQQDRLRIEPEKIRIWREEQAAMLQKKDAESEKKKAEWREQARRELDEWHKHREEQLEKTKKVNRESEDAFVTERDEKKPGGEWERVCRLCDFNPKGSRNTKDVSRMRSILLQLKQTPIERQ